MIATMRTAVISLLIVSGCDVRPASTQEEQSQKAILLSSVALTETATSHSTLPIPNTTEGSLVILGLSCNGYGIQSISAGESTFTPWLASGINNCGLKSTEIWVLRNSPADLKSITITADTAGVTNLRVTELEFGGFPPLPYFSSVSGNPSPDSAKAPVLDADQGQVVVSTMTTCGKLSGMAADSPFTLIDTEESDGSTAYLIASEPGSFGGEWNYEGGTAVGNTVVFGTRFPSQTE